MRQVRSILLVGAALWASPANSADALKYGAPPAWVVQQAIPTAKASDAPVALLLNDQQIAFDKDKITTYTELAFKIQSPQGLAAGNLSLGWQPDHDTVTVNKVQIRRGDKVIDVLGAGQSFTVMRRESNLEAAMLDGTLTANIQPEGLQEGDVIDLATTTEHADPVLKGHMEASFAAWNGLPIQAGHVLITWPAGTNLTLRESANLPPVQRSMRNGRSIAEFSANGLEPLIAPKGAPIRYGIGRLGEASDFADWSDVARLMMPLYSHAAVIPPSGPLRTELEKIRVASNDPKVRAAQALALVQDRIRYVALLMAQGGLVPATAEQTWSRRFGDCKAKTVLLLGLLHELGIEAEPVLVNSKLGDAIADRLPMLGLFDHVLVRAHIADKSYWLDGTRAGDTSLDDIQPPDFGWVLPLVDNAALVHIVPPPLNVAESETRLEIDASSGIYAPAPTTAEQVIRGEVAVLLQSQLAAASEQQRSEFFEGYWKKVFDFVTYKSGSSSFDKAKRELHFTMTGSAKLDWSRGSFHVPNSSVGYNPDFDRSEAQLREAPFAVSYPDYSRTVVRLRLPPSFIVGREFGDVDVHETLAGIEYKRTAAIEGDRFTVETSERSVVPEITAKEARAAAARLRALDDEDVALPLTAKYRPTEADLAGLGSSEPASAKEYLRRGLTFLRAAKFDEAIADFTKAHELDPQDIWPLANRGIAYVTKERMDLAEADLRIVEARQPDNPVLLRARGLQAQQTGDCAKAVDVFSRSLEVDPGNNFAIGHRAFCEASLSKTDEALADSALALKADPTWLDLRVLRANIFVRQGKNDQVAKEAELATTENPRSSFAYVAAGKIYARLKRTSDAMKAFDGALAIKPEAYVYLNRAQARPFSDRSGRRADLDAALKLEPRNPDALAEKAEELAAGGDLKGARQLYDQVIKALPDISYYKARLAVLLFKTGDLEGARKSFAELRSAAKSANDFNSLCWAKATAGILLDVALDECREALKREPDTGAYLDSLALVELRLGKVDTAIADYTRAISKNIGAASYMGRALAYSQKGDKAHAAADLAQALQLDPDAQMRFSEFGLKLDQSVHSTAH